MNGNQRLQNGNVMINGLDVSNLCSNGKVSDDNDRLYPKLELNFDEEEEETDEKSTPFQVTYSMNARRKRQLQAQHQMAREDRPTVRVAPTLYVTLRGAQETWDALENGNVTKCECLECAMRMFCIQDAHYVLCPSCKIIQPLEGRRRIEFRLFAGGLGLGVPIEACEHVPLTRHRSERVLRTSFSRRASDDMDDENFSVGF
mmetsp:Transcript_13246/g.20080  ORF Transcript_13246/g.20080 Transcript_13246/m.20080 type:complete len:202 (+) Transcript_13246:139-744(+)